ncbi:MAG TPA: class I SAM-dependent methyltransferase [Gemmatimonadaceae bacterium]|nr:class I SAM-dependent methyltransferase [Gemmatimonadaceae bacterium]
MIGQDGVWADLGAGGGLFTRALVHLLSSESRVIAVDSDPAAVAALERLAATSPTLTALQADLTDFTAEVPLDGILLANSLHFVEHAGAVLARLVTQLRPGGRVVLVEYDRRSASRWVPYPVAIGDLPALATAAGLSKFTVVESRPSNYEGIIYAAVASLPT